MRIIVIEGANGCAVRIPGRSGLVGYGRDIHDAVCNLFGTRYPPRYHISDSDAN